MIIIPKIKIKCDYCGKIIERYASQIHPHYNTCSRTCSANLVSKKNVNYKQYKNFETQSRFFSELNRKLNPKRGLRKQKQKIDFVGPPYLPPEKEARPKGHINESFQCKNSTYKKYPGTTRHAHRIIMEQIIGRPLKKGEVVHHIDGNRQNNNPENLKLFSSQSEHAKWHAHFKQKRGDV